MFALLLILKSQLIEKCEIEKENKFYISDSSNDINAKKLGSFTIKDAFKNIGLSQSPSQIRMKEKKWHADSHMIHNHSFYHNFHPQSKFKLLDIIFILVAVHKNIWNGIKNINI